MYEYMYKKMYVARKEKKNILFGKEEKSGKSQIFKHMLKNWKRNDENT